jgi:F0F1-type ATP synthase assembly protein I
MPDDRDNRRSDEDAKKSAGPSGAPLKGAEIIGAGFEFIAVTGLLTALGWWIDGKAGTSPVLLIVGMMIGLIGSTYKLWKLGVSINRKR